MAVPFLTGAVQLSVSLNAAACLAADTSKGSCVSFVSVTQIHNYTVGRSLRVRRRGFTTINKGCTRGTRFAILR